MDKRQKIKKLVYLQIAAKQEDGKFVHMHAHTVHAHVQLLSSSCSRKIGLQLPSSSSERSLCWEDDWVCVHSLTVTCLLPLCSAVVSEREWILTVHLLYAKQCALCFKHLGSLILPTTQWSKFNYPLWSRFWGLKVAHAVHWVTSPTRELFSSWRWENEAPNVRNLTVVL